MKRFYKSTGINAENGGFAVLLDGKGIKTPAGQAMLLPTRALAEAIAGEWQAQGDVIAAHTMPLMQLAATTLDHVSQGRVVMMERLMAYLGSDTVCHFVDEPKRLREMQDKLFTPVLAWLRRRYDIDMRTTTELTAVMQPPVVLQRVSAVLDAMNDWELMGVQTAALAAGSIALALAMHDKAFFATEIFDAAEVESTYQIEKWGSDAELEKRRSDILNELNAVERWFELLA